MHASIPTTYVSLIFLYFFLFSFFFLVLPFLLSFLLSLVPPPLLLFTATTFYTICLGEIYQFYLSTTFNSLWVSFQDCPLACRLLSHYHGSEFVGCTTPHSRTKLLVLFLTSPCFFTTLIWIRIKLLYHLPLWHASSGPSLHLLLLGEMPS